MNLFCTQCGTKLGEGSIFCTQCGTKLSPPISEPPFGEIAAPITVAEALPVVEIALPPIVTQEESVTLPEPELFSFAPPASSSSSSLPQESAPPFVPAASEANESDLVGVTEPVFAGVPDLPYSPDSPGLSDSTDSIEVVTSQEVMQVEKPSKPPQSKGTKILIAIASVLISVVLFAAATAGQSWFILQNSIKNQTVGAMARAAINSVDLAEFPIFDYVNADDFIEQLHEGVRGNFTGEEVLYQAIYNSIDDYYKQEAGIEEKDIIALLEQEEFLNFLGNVVDGGVDYFLGGNDSKIVSTREVRNLLQNNKNKDLIRDITGWRLDDERDVADIENFLKNSGLEDLTWGSAVGNSSNTGTVRNFLAFGSGMLMIVLIAVVFVGFVALLLFLNRRRMTNSLMYAGIPLCVSGGVVVAASILANMVFGWLGDGLGIGGSVVRAIRNAFTSGVGTNMIVCGTIVFGVGAVAIGVKVVISLAQRKKMRDSA
ncbi:MAG: zinc-ribbon domain-containing protein [Oscillospiraceae bacterium]|nr:zinc-ribbon domain-containing protein [Oscillospiraceae bacterium]